MAIKTLDEMLATVKGAQNRRVAIAAGNDPHTIEAAEKAVRENVVDITLIGNRKKMEGIAVEKQIDLGLFDIVDEADEWKAGKKAVGMVRNKENFNRNHYELLKEADQDSFQQLIEQWTLDYAEQYSAADV